LPDVERGAVATAVRGGLVGFGLPYEREAAITRHLAAFLDRHGLEGGPDAVLFNGGIFRAARIRARLLEALGHFAGRPIQALPESDPDLAVALGAVGYGLALDGHGVRIAGGTARGYYVGLAGAARRAVCVVPRGAEEGERHLVASQPLALVVGAPVRFELYSSDSRVDTPGAVTAIDADAFDELPPVAVLLEASESAEPEVRVQIEGELTPVGTLELACVETESGRRHKLSFEVRAAADSEPPRQSRRAVPHKLDAAKQAVERVFGKGRTDVAPKEVKGLVRELEKILGDRGEWTIEETRALFDEVAADVRARRRSPDHERVFWMLAGFCLRPGYGHPLDDKRVAKIAHLLNEGLTFKDESRGWQQFWIAWRRLAGGLGDRTQQALLRAVEPFVAPEDPKRKKPKGFRPQGQDEMLVLVSSLERLPPEKRAELGEWFLERTWTSRDPRLWAAIGRIGARVPTYASAHHAVKPSIAEAWLDHLLREKWDEMPSAARAALSMARVTGDRARDVSPRVRAEVEKRLAVIGAEPQWQRAVREFVAIAEKDRVEFFGEGLPVGLKWVGVE
jgi:hypothetical protein